MTMTDDVEQEPSAWRWIIDQRTNEMMRAWPQARILLSQPDGTPPSLNVVTCKAAEVIDRVDNIPTEFHDVARRWTEAKRRLEKKKAREYLKLATFKDPETNKAPAKWVIDAQVAVACEEEADAFAIVEAERDSLDVAYRVLPELRALIQTISASQRDLDSTPRRNYR